jgi:hypothetical protein
VAEFDDADGFTQPIYLLDQQRAFAVRKRNSEEIRAARNQGDVLGFITFSPTYADS